MITDKVLHAARFALISNMGKMENELARAVELEAIAGRKLFADEYHQIVTRQYQEAYHAWAELREAFIQGRYEEAA